MRLSTKGQYALEAMVTIALANSDALLSIHAISQKTGVSEPYLEQIIVLLRKDGLVDSVRGTQGGYRLARTAEQITVGEVLRSGEGSMAPVRCIENGSEDCPTYEACMTRFLWQDMADAISSIIDRQTLADIVKIWRRERQDPVLDFSI